MLMTELRMSHYRLHATAILSRRSIVPLLYKATHAFKLAMRVLQNFNNDDTDIGLLPTIITIYAIQGLD